MSDLERINPETVTRARQGMNQPESLRNSIDNPGRTKLTDLSAERKAKWLIEVNLDSRFSGATFETFDKKAQPRAAEKSMEFAAACLNTTEDSLALVLSSAIYGSGKTHLLAAIAHRIIEQSEAAYLANYSDGSITYNLQTTKYRPCPVYYVNETDLLSRIRGAYDRDSQDNELDIYTRLNKYPLLLIDDVGKVRARDSSFTQQVYYRLVEYRWSNYKHIALASNLVDSGLEDYIGGAVSSRLAQMTQGKYYLTLTGDDYRLKGSKGKRS